MSKQKDIMRALLVVAVGVLVVAGGITLGKKMETHNGFRIGDMTEVQHGFYRGCRAMLVGRVEEGYVATMMCLLNGEAGVIQGHVVYGSELKSLESSDSE